MKAVILAGGLGTRISEESHLRPKPMIEIGGKPIIWHIMKIYSAHAINDFVVCVGYKGYLVKEYFHNYFLHNADVTIDLAANKVEVHYNGSEPWRVTVVDTGEHTATGGRLKRVQRYLGEEDFCFTYGDGVSSVDLRALVRFHKQQRTRATVTAVQLPGRFGSLNMEKKKIVGFEEKPKGDGGWISGGFFVLSPEVFSYIDDDATVWERRPMERLAKEGNLSAFVHTGFWHPMDTLRDKLHLDELWASGNPPWKIW